MSHRRMSTRNRWLGISLGVGLLVLLGAALLPAIALRFGPGMMEVETTEIGALEVAQTLAPALEPNAPLAVSAPEDMACRHYNGKTDQVLLQWDDTNNGSADYELYREDVANTGWSLLTTVTGGTCDDGTCQFIDSGASNSTVFRYRTRAKNGGDTSSYSSICREPLVQEDPANQFRVFYRLEPTECPTVDSKQTCTQNVPNGSGQNIHVMQMIATHESFRQEYIDLGFKDFAFFGGVKPFPIDMYPCNNGCANSQGIQIPPANLEGTNYNPDTGGGKDYEVFVVGHEGFHKVQGSYGAVVDPYYKWLIEGQARSTEDKSCIFATVAQCNIWDNQVDKYYASAVASYLGFPEQALLEASYNAAFFWTYIVEQFGTPTSGPDTGMDSLVNYWLQNEVNAGANDSKDGIGTLDDTLATMGSSRRFEDIFQDFAVANYLKDYITNPAPAGLEKYNYVDEEAYSLNGGTFGSVKLTENRALAPDQSVFGTTSVQAWGTRYFQINPDPAVSTVNIEVEALAGTNHPLYYKVVLIDNGNIVGQYDDVGTSLQYSIDNTPDYDRIALIVASMDNPVNFTYGFNLTDGIFILAPTTAVPASVGELTSPEKFILQLVVLDEVGDPVGGIPTSEFTITVGSTVISPTLIIGSSYIAGQYWITVRAPSDPGNCTTLCDLSVDYAAYNDLKEDAILYGPKPDTDNMIIIDRSGSMAGDKIVAAKDAAKLYADSYSEGDRIGVTSFNTAPNEEYPLDDWTEGNRPIVAQAIDDIAAPSGLTANGAALRDGNAKLVAQASPNPAWSIVLLSDGKDTVADTDDHIAKYVSEWASAEDDGDQVPVVHVVAVGDDSDGVELSKLTNKTGGIFQFLPVPSEMASVASGDAMNATSLVGALAEIYRVFAEEVLDEQQIYVQHFAKQTQLHIDTIQVEKGASQAIFVLEYSPPTATLPTIWLNDPNGGGPAAKIAPTLTADGHMLWRIPSPEPGAWTLGVRFGCGAECPETYMVEAALVSDLTLKAFLGVPVEDRIVGKPMPIVAFLSDVAPLTGATMTALSETTGEMITLHDDGMHGDGAANDGAYGGTLVFTNLPGGYSVVIDAAGTSPFAGPYTRRVRLGFYLPDGPDSDKDRLPDWWEIEYGTDPSVPDANLDPDGDDLFTAQEYTHKTHPLDPDTDDGGENDGSEVGRDNDPLFPGDDNVQPPTFRPWAGPGRAILRLVLAKTVDHFVIERAPLLTPAVPGPFIAVFSGTVPINEYVDPSLQNDMPYCYRVISTEGDASATSTVQCTTPRSDPNPPHGVVDVREESAVMAVATLAQPQAVPPTVTLLLDGEDNPNTEEHPAFDGEFLFPDAVMSGVTEMMISNQADFAGAVWEPYATTKRWTLLPSASGQATVFVLYKDAAGNVSDVAYATVTVDENLAPAQTDLFLPSVAKP